MIEGTSKKSILTAYSKNSQALAIQGFAGFLFALLVGLTILDDQGGKNHAEDENEIPYCDSHRNF